MRSSSRLAGLMQSLQSAQTWRVFLAVNAIVLIAHYAVLPRDLRIPSGTLLAVASAAAIAVTLMARRRIASSDLAFVAGLGLLAMGNSMTGSTRPFPSLSDLGYLLGTAFIAFGAARRYIPRRGVRADVLLEGVIVTAAGSLVVYELIVQRILLALGFNLFPTVVALAYPAVDLMLLAVTVRIVIASPRRDGAMWLIVAGCASYLASDVVVSTQLLGSSGSAAAFADLGWLASYGFLAAGIIHPGAVTAPVRGGGEVSSRPRVALLLGAAMLSPLLVLYELAVGEFRDVALVAVVGVLLSALVVVRLALALGALGRTIDQRQQLQVELEHQASHDHLTGLANRDEFTQALDRAVKGGVPVTVLLVELDDFNVFNDSLGRDNGDQLLREVAARITATLGLGDLAARLGGDEFAVLLPEVVTADMADVAGARLLDAIRQPVTLGGRIVLVRASIGIALSDRFTADELMRNAGIAIYLAKSQGKDRCQRFDVRLHDDVLARMRVRLELEAAIEAREFVVHYQPIIDVATGRLIMTEALVRWQHPGRGLLAPAEFIDVAEATGMIVPLGRWVLNEALAATRRWQVELARPDLGVSVNVAPRQFEHAAFRDDVIAALASSGMAPERVTLEMTESALLDTPTTTAILGELKALGVRIAIDDFGTGYSSLSYIGRLPIDMVKIDRTFVAALGNDSKEGALAASVIRLGKALDVTTIAEGIEDSRQLEMLRTLGCDLAQGYFLARPMTPDAIAALIRREAGIMATVDRRPTRRRSQPAPVSSSAKRQSRAPMSIQ